MSGILQDLRARRWYWLGRKKILKSIRSWPPQKALKVNLGAAYSAAIQPGIEIEGWLMTDIPHFNIIRDQDWNYFFDSRKPKYLMAEHVLEHLTTEEVSQVLKLASLYMCPDGNFRIAVPDGLHPDPAYQDNIRPTGHIGNIHGHRSLWNYRNLSELASCYGFKIKLLEYYDEKGSYHLHALDPKNGSIQRTGHRGDPRTHASLIVDLYR